MDVEKELLFGFQGAEAPVFSLKKTPLEPHLLHPSYFFNCTYFTSSASLQKACFGVADLDYSFLLALN